MFHGATLLALAQLALIPLLGRCLLAWLPPGGFGAHRPSRWPETLAISYLLGCLGSAVWAVLAASVGVAATGAASLAVPIAAVGLARALTLPGAMAPRHDPPAERPSVAARLLGWAALGLCAFAAFGRGWDTAPIGRAIEALQLSRAGAGDGRGALCLELFDTLSLRRALGASVDARALAWIAPLHAFALSASTIVLADSAMALTRRAALARRALLVPLAATLLPAATSLDGDLAAAALIALTCAGAVAWLRRADRRGLALAGAGLAALAYATAHGGILALLGLGATVACSAPPSRVRALRTAGAALALMAPLLLWAWRQGRSAFDADPWASLASTWSLDDARVNFAWIAPLWIALGAALGPACFALVRADHEQLEAGHPDRTRRDLAWSLAWLGAIALALLGFALSVEEPTAWVAHALAPSVLVPLAPLATLACARALARGEQRA